MSSRRHQFALMMSAVVALAMVDLYIMLQITSISSIPLFALSISYGIGGGIGGVVNVGGGVG